MEFNLLYGDGISIKGEKSCNVNWDEIENILRKLSSDSSLYIYRQPPPISGPLHLSLLVSEDGNYFLITAPFAQGGVMSLINYDMKEIPDIEIIGDYYPSSMVTTDFEHIKKMIKTFYDTGDVPKEMWVVGTKK